MTVMSLAGLDMVAYKDCSGHKASGPRALLTRTSRGFQAMGITAGHLQLRHRVYIVTAASVVPGPVIQCLAPAPAHEAADGLKRRWPSDHFTSPGIMAGHQTSAPGKA